MANDLNPYENITRVFWIKIEVKEDRAAGLQSFGVIKDVMSGERRPIRELLDILGFIIPYLQKMDIEIHWFWRFTVWIYGKIRRSK